MKLTNKGRYAVMAMADLASNANEGPISLTEISLRQNISLAYLEQIFLKLKKIDKQWYRKKIDARFICALTIFGLKKKPIQSIGIIKGKISPKKIGKNGFGYDPIFIPDGKRKTFGQMKYSNKLKIDHRSKAFKKIKKFF